MNTLRAWLAVTAAVAATAALAPSSAEARPLTVKLATLAPEGSPWHELLKDLAARWDTLSDGQVRLRVYPGGVAGDELDVLRKMRIGQFQAAAFTSLGLGGISEDTRILIIPRLMRNDHERQAVMAALGPKLQQSLADGGAVVLGWATAGWVQFFVPRQMTDIDDVRKVKLFVWAGDEDAIRLWKQAGFNVVPLPATEILTGLQTGLIEAIDAPPAVAFVSQWYRHTPYMLDMHWAPFPGALVINKQTWEAIPAELQPGLKAAAEETARRMTSESVRLEREAIESMKQRGLEVLAPSAEAIAEWDAAVEAIHPKLRGGYVDAKLFDAALEAVRSCR